MPGTHDQNVITTWSPVGPAPHGAGDGDGVGDGDSWATWCVRTAALGGAAPISRPAATTAAAAVATSPWLALRCETRACMSVLLRSTRLAPLARLLSRTGRRHGTIDHDPPQSHTDRTPPGMLYRRGWRVKVCL